MPKLSAVHWAAAYLVVVNVATFFVYGIDKWKARHAKWRVSEAALLALAVVGGSIGAWLGMKAWHHKTLHRKFRYGIPAIVLLQVILVLLVSCGTGQTAANRQDAPEHSPSVFLVMYDAETGKEPLLQAIKEHGVEIVYDYSIINGMALKKPEGKALEATMAAFRKVKGVVSVEHDHTYHLTDTDEPKWDKQ